MSKKIIDIVSHNLVTEKFMAEERLVEAIMSDVSIDDKIEKISKAINELRESSINISIWEGFIDKNLVIEKENNEPEGDNNK